MGDWSDGPVRRDAALWQQRAAVRETDVLMLTGPSKCR